MNRSMPVFMTIDEVAERLSVTPRTLRNWVARGDLPIHRFGGAIRVSATDLEEFVHNSRDPSIRWK